jgi:hypothetical protein
VRRPSLRRIVGMLGYVPSPGSAGSAAVAAIAEGKTGLTVPKGTAIRSSAFTGPLPDAQGSRDPGIPTSMDESGLHKKDSVNYGASSHLVRHWFS